MRLTANQLIVDRNTERFALDGRDQRTRVTVLLLNLFTKKRDYSTYVPLAVIMPVHCVSDTTKSGI